MLETHEFILRPRCPPRNNNFVNLTLILCPTTRINIYIIYITAPDIFHGWGGVGIGPALK